MIVQRFHDWCQSASCAERCYGVAALAAAWAEGRIPPDERNHLEAAFSLILDDPSPKVRHVLAEAVAGSRAAPRIVVRALCDDVDEVACVVAARSPLLSDADLVDLAAAGSTRLQETIAGRAFLPPRVAAALAEVGCRTACLTLLANREAAIAPITFRRLAERFGEDGGIRAALIDRDDLPVWVRQSLVRQLATALSTMPLARNLLGSERTGAVTQAACERATVQLAESASGADIPALVEHLRLSGELSAAFLIRAVCRGNVDLFAAALTSLSGRSERRVRAIVVDGRRAAFTSLLVGCGLPADLAPLLRSAVQIWKKTVVSRTLGTSDAVPLEVMRQIEEAFAASAESSSEELASLLRRLTREAADDAVRFRARRLLAA
ncbi:DUF2336 domain-containing protein [Consotaella aegiceratis]|uniref:DUF2336 domain-containing protein n=1 Tax=Consotaella aegiceratis TaxID=3097961 RepID=UPI002F3F615F